MSWPKGRCRPIGGSAGRLAGRRSAASGGAASGSPAVDDAGAAAARAAAGVTTAGGGAENAISPSMAPLGGGGGGGDRRFLRRLSRAGSVDRHAGGLSNRSRRGARSGIAGRQPGGAGQRQRDRTGVFRRRTQGAAASGAAYFIVAPLGGAESRPFRVEAENGVTQALGTEFSVACTGGVDVSVHQHSVRVTLERGERSRWSCNARRRITATALQLTRQTAGDDAWRRGWLVIDRQPLPQALAQLNRYRATRIVAVNPALERAR
ncbi:FecR domain-containing protein [Serratia ureilytica]